MGNNVSTKSRIQRRAIAGIVVALILIAVAVVGGIAVFMFTQGFIGQTQVTSPSIDVIEVFGYDARDANSLTSHTGTAIAINTGSVDSILDDDDAINLYIRNRGAGIVVLDQIRVFGTAYTLSIVTPCAANTAPAKGTFSISSDGALANCGQTSIASGEEVTVYVRYAETTNGEVALGRPIPITVVTANGIEITKQLSNGAQSG